VWEKMRKEKKLTRQDSKRVNRVTRNRREAIKSEKGNLYIIRILRTKRPAGAIRRAWATETCGGCPIRKGKNNGMEGEGSATKDIVFTGGAKRQQCLAQTYLHHRGGETAPAREKTPIDERVPGGTCGEGQ